MTDCSSWPQSFSLLAKLTIPSLLLRTARPPEGPEYHGQTHPEEPIRSGQLRPLDRAFENVELVA